MNANEKNISKIKEYSFKMHNKLMELFDEQDEQHISYEELMEGDNATVFIHCLANLAPSILYNHLTGANQAKDLLEFNHLANRLIFQFDGNENT